MIISRYELKIYNIYKEGSRTKAIALRKLKAKLDECEVRLKR